MVDWTTSDVPDQSGRVAVVTGANSGLGLVTAAALAAAGATVVLAVRDPEKGRQAQAHIRAATAGAKVEVQRLDLGSLASVREAAAELRDRFPQLDLLINNAGVMFAGPSASTDDGFEMQLGTNHLGHFALTGLLLDRMLTVAGSRVVTVTSNGHRQARIDFDDLHWRKRRYSYLGAYGQSKLANVLFTYGLQRRLAAHRTIATVAHPGASKTNLDRNTPARLVPVIGVFRLVAQDVSMGALPTLRAAADPTIEGGQYLGPGGPGQWRGYPKVVDSSRDSHDVSVQERLWRVSEELTGVTFPLPSGHPVSE